MSAPRQVAGVATGGTLYRHLVQVMLGMHTVRSCRLWWHSDRALRSLPTPALTSMTMNTALGAAPGSVMALEHKTPQSKLAAIRASSIIGPHARCFGVQEQACGKSAHGECAHALEIQARGAGPPRECACMQAAAGAHPTSAGHNACRRRARTPSCRATDTQSGAAPAGRCGPRCGR